MIVLLEIMSVRLYCKPCLNGFCETLPPDTEGILQVGNTAINDLTEIKIGETIAILALDNLVVTQPIESLRLVDSGTLEFITRTVSYRLTIKE